MSSIARGYLETALRIMQSSSINTAQLDWPKLRADGFAAAINAKTTRDTYPAIRRALRALGDNHSFLREPVAGPIAPSVPPTTLPSLEGRRIGADVGYIRVPAFAGANASQFAKAIQDAIREADAPTVCAWVVDLRGNSGGNMWPMLQGLKPILGDSSPGFFLTPAGRRTPWHVDSLPDNYRLYSSDPAVAVIHDEETASSGEAVVVAFRGRRATKSFGRGTRGLSTANATIPLPDGATMFLTTAVFVDRLGVRYGGVIAPDHPAASDALPNRILEEAVLWIRGESSCNAKRSSARPNELMMQTGSHHRSRGAGRLDDSEQFWRMDGPAAYQMVR